MQARAAQSAVTGLAAFAMAALLLAVKAPDALRNAQFWAEDGSVFFAQQWGNGGLPWLEPYAGYLHLLPRLVASLASPLPPESAPWAYNVMAWLLDALALAYAAHRLGQLGNTGPAWPLLALALVPAAGDIYGPVTNVQWFTQFALVLGSMRIGTADADTAPWAAWVERLALLAAALSGPFALIWLLVLGAGTTVAWLTGHLVRWRDRFRMDILLVLAVAAAMQFIVILTHPQGTPEAASQLDAAAQLAFGVASVPRHAYVLIVSNRLHPLHLMLWAFYLVCTVAVAWHAWRRRDAATWPLMAVMVFGLLQPLLAFAKQREPHTLASPSHYFLLLGAASIWLSGLAAMRAGLPRRPLLIAALALWLGGLALYPDYFRRAPLVDLHWAGHAARLHGATACTIIPLNPLPWHARVPARGLGLTCLASNQARGATPGSRAD